MDPRASRTEDSKLPRIVRRLALAVLPRQYHVAARYHYRRIFGTLDDEIHLLRDLAGDRRTAIDIGANLGVYTYVLSQLCRRVEAFEPVPEYADLLRSFHSRSVHVHQVALSSHPGTQQLFFAGNGNAVDRGRGSLSPMEPSGSFIETRVPMNEPEG